MLEIDGNVLAYWHNEEFQGIAFKSELMYENDMFPFVRIKEAGVAIAVLQGSESP